MILEIKSKKKKREMARISDKKKKKKRTVAETLSLCWQALPPPYFGSWALYLHRILVFC